MKTAVVYYSLGGSTRSFARAEARAHDADLIELQPAHPYNLFTAFVRGCPAAIRQQAVPLRQAPDLSGYDHIILLAPIWANHPAPPFNSAAALLPQVRRSKWCWFRAAAKAARTTRCAP